MNGNNGFANQAPYLDHVISKKADVAKVYLPPDANCLMSVFDHCLRSKHYVNVVVAREHALPQWLKMHEADTLHTGIGIWPVAGDTVKLECLSAVSILREHLPELKIRFVNMVDLMKMQSSYERPYGLSEMAYDRFFT